MNKEEFKFGLLLSFHEQFSQNQNNHQKLFIQFASILLTVIIGFGYTLFNFTTTGKSELNSNVGIFEFSAAFVVSELIATIGIALICNLALGFRRDQMVLSRIRTLADSIPEINDKENKVFPISYNPLINYYNKFIKNNKKVFLDWMPDFHSIFTCAFIVIQFLLICVYLIKLALNNYLSDYGDHNIFNYPALISILGFISFIFSFMIIRYFQKKMKSIYLKNGMQDLIDERYNNGKST